MKRRRFLQILAAGALVAPPARAVTWSGQALGSEVSLRLQGGPAGAAQKVLSALPALLAKVERQFSLFDAASALCSLNRDGQLSAPSDDFLHLMHLSDDLHRRTFGMFDPTVQPLWQALAKGEDTAAARRAIGWHKVGVRPDRVTLRRGQALTMNGLAQGYATDLVKELLRSNGFDRALINIGEHAALGGPWHLGIADPAHGQLATRSVTGTAIATSSANATMVGGRAHILHPTGGPLQWSTVSVEADTAALADGLSTALVLLPLQKIEHLVATTPAVRRVVLVDLDGNLTSLAQRA